MGPKIIELIERMVKQGMPGGLEIATVKSVSPLSIRIDAMSSDIPAAFLYLSESLVEHEVTVEAMDLDVQASTTTNDLHSHSIHEMVLSESSLTVKTRLQNGDRVAVLPLSGGQKYFLVEKVVSAS